MPADPLRLPTEAYAAHLRTAIQQLSDLVAPLATVADTHTTQADGYWRLTLIPHVQQACAIDLFLRADQMIDVAIGPEAIEGIPAGDLKFLSPLVAAVVRGDVITRRYSATVTAAELAVESRVTFADGSVWARTRQTALGRQLPDAAPLLNDTYYVPYVAGDASAAAS